MLKPNYITKIISIIAILSLSQWCFAALNGPIVDAYQQPFLYVYGTISPNPFENDVIRRTAVGVVDKWKLLRNRIVPIKKDTEVTPEDIQRYHLIIYGNERSNKILREIGPQLPIRITEEAIIVGDRKYTHYEHGAIFIAPNPLNPNRYVLIYGALNHHGFPNINAVRASDTDFVIFSSENKMQIGSRPMPPLEEGYFDKSDPFNWRVIPLPQSLSIAEETPYQPIGVPTVEK